MPPIPGLDQVDYLTNETLFEQTRKPGHLIVVGGGPIGMEMAQAHRRLGSEVTVIEAFKAMGKDDPELVSIVLDRIRDDGVEMMEETKVVSVEKRGKNGVRVTVEHDGEQSHVDGTHILVATGRAPNTENLGLDAAGIAHDRRSGGIGRLGGFRGIASGQGQQGEQGAGQGSGPDRSAEREENERIINASTPEL